MPPKNAITLSEMVLLALTWSACQNVWRTFIIDGLNQGAQTAFPRFPMFAQKLVVGAVLMGVLYAAILLSARFNIGRYKVFELAE